MSCVLQFGQLSVFDFEEGLCLVVGKVDFVVDMLVMLLVLLVVDCQVICQVCDNDDCIVLFERVYWLYGVICYCGVLQLCVVCQISEILFKQNDLVVVVVLDELDKVIEVLVDIVLVIIYLFFISFDFSEF